MMYLNDKELYDTETPQMGICLQFEGESSKYSDDARAVEIETPILFKDHPIASTVIKDIRARAKSCVARAVRKRVLGGATVDINLT